MLREEKTTLIFMLHNAMLVTFNESYSHYVYTAFNENENLRTFVEKYRQQI